MTRHIIEEEEGKGLSINTYWNGNEEGVQFTILKDYVHMTRTEAILFLESALLRLKKQVEDDKVNPPWWQELGK